MRILIFSSSSCSVCLPLKEKLKRIAREFGADFREIDVEKEREEAVRRMIFSAPTVVLEVGGKEFGIWSGVFSVSEIEEAVRRLKEIVS